MVGRPACEASEVVNAHFVVQLEHAAQALHPPPEAVLLMCLHGQSCFTPTMQNVDEVHQQAAIEETYVLNP